MVLWIARFWIFETGALLTVKHIIAVKIKRSGIRGRGHFNLRLGQSRFGHPLKGHGPLHMRRICCTEFRKIAALRWSCMHFVMRIRS